MGSCIVVFAVATHLGQQDKMKLFGVSMMLSLLASSVLGAPFFFSTGNRGIDGALGGAALGAAGGLLIGSVLNNPRGGRGDFGRGGRFGGRGGRFGGRGGFNSGF